MMMSCQRQHLFYNSHLSDIQSPVYPTTIVISHKQYKIILKIYFDKSFSKSLIKIVGLSLLLTQNNDVVFAKHTKSVYYKLNMN